MKYMYIQLHNGTKRLICDIRNYECVHAPAGGRQGIKNPFLSDKIYTTTALSVTDKHQ